MLQLFNSLKIQRLQLDLEGFKGFAAKARIIGVGASREFSGFELLESERANGTGYELRGSVEAPCPMIATLAPELGQGVVLTKPP